MKRNKTINMAKLKVILSSDLQKCVSKGENAQQPHKISKENVIFVSMDSHVLPKIELRTTRIALKDWRAVVYGNTEAESESNMTMELTFANENDMWKLESENELLSNLEAELRKATSEYDTEQSVNAIETDNGAGNRTIALRALSEEYNIQKLTKSVIRNKLNRNLFANPYTGVLAKHPSEVTYPSTDLNPSVDYEFKADFFNKVGYDLKQSIHVDQTQVIQEAEVPAGFNSAEWTALPRENFFDGSGEIRFKKESGEGDAVASHLWMRKSRYDPDNTPDKDNISENISDEYSLRQNYPNPFNAATSIEFGVPVGIANNVTLRIYNTLGHTVNVLMNGQLPPGRHTIAWNGRDSFNRQVSSGVFFYQLKASKHSELKKMILMKIS